MSTVTRDTAPSAVEAIDISKQYGSVQALKPSTFSIQPGRYSVLLGPSGGGKTTTLRLIGGLVRPSSGRILINGEDVTRLPPNRRDTSMVFQSYALFPHMTVEQNVGYGLTLRRLPASEISGKVNAMLELVNLTGFNARKPHELSGGQQQRVQLARSLVLDCALLLLDEPLAALDAKLRKSMCLELKRIQQDVGVTFVHVTHNQEEAMTVADRIAVIADGELVEEGSVRDIYEQPRRKFTADFIGETNLLDGRVSAVGAGTAAVDLGFASVEVNTTRQSVAAGDQVSLSIRSELTTVVAAKDGAIDGYQSLPAEYVGQVYLGYSSTSIVRLPNGQEASARSLSAADAFHHASGESVRLVWATANARLHAD